MEHLDFEAGKCYTRDEIHARIGGNIQGMMPTVRGSVVACCIRPEKNYDYRNKLLIGNFPRKLPTAKQWARERNSVPFFVKQAARQWEFIGHYRVVQDSEDAAVLEAEREHDEEVAIVLYVKPSR